MFHGPSKQIFVAWLSRCNTCVVSARPYAAWSGTNYTAHAEIGLGGSDPRDTFGRLYRTVQVQARQHLKHIEARDRAFWLVIIIPFLALVPLTCFAQTKKSEAKAQVQPAPASAPVEGCYELKLSRWWPWGFGEENKYVTPPTHIELLGEHGTRGFEQDKPLIRTIPTSRQNARRQGIFLLER